MLWLCFTAPRDAIPNAQHCMQFLVVSSCFRATDALAGSTGGLRLSPFNPTMFLSTGAQGLHLISLWASFGECIDSCYEWMVLLCSVFWAVSFTSSRRDLEGCPSCSETLRMDLIACSHFLLARLTLHFLIRPYHPFFLVMWCNISVTLKTTTVATGTLWCFLRNLFEI